MKKEKKVIKHRILDRNTVLGMVLLTALSYLMVSIVIGFVVGGIVGITVRLLNIPGSETILYVAYAAAAFLMLAIHKRWFYPEFESNIRTDNLGRWLLNGLGILLAIIVPDIIIMLVTKGNYAAPTLTTLHTSLMAGVTEEIIFRAVPVSYGMRQIKESKKIPMVLVTSTLIFALFHATNIFAGANAQATLIQVFSTFGAGAVMCALFLRSGSILPSMMLHFLYDVYALMNADSVSESGIMAEALGTRDIVCNIVIFAVEIGLVLFLLRKSVLEDVMTLWNKKWNKAENNEQI